MKPAHLALFLLIFILASNTLYAQSPSVLPPDKQFFVINPKFNPQGVPATETKKLNMKKSTEVVTKAFADLDAEVKAKCAAKMAVYRVEAANSELKVTAFKNLKLPVSGKFTHFAGYLFWDKDDSKNLDPKAYLLIDSGSYDSGVPDRDQRVMNYLLKADRKNDAFAALDLAALGKATLDDGQKIMKGALNFRGNKYEISAINMVKKNGEGWTIESAQPTRLNAKIPFGDLKDIMKLCNHESIASAVDLDWKLQFVPACNP